MGKAAALVAATHPVPAVAVTGFTIAVAAAAGAPAATVGWLAAAVLAGQASIGWGNDYVDRHRDRSAGRRDKPLARGLLPDRTVGLAAVAALGACVPLSFALGRAAGLAHLAAVAAAWSYNLGLKATVASPLPYAAAFGILPPWLVALSLPGAPAPRAAPVVAAAVLGVSAHFANTLDDVEADRRTGVRGLPQRIGPVWSARLAAVLLVLAAVVLLGPWGMPKDWAGVPALAAVVGYAVRLARPAAPGDRRRAFAAYLVMVALVVASFAAAGGRLVS